MVLTEGEDKNPCEKALHIVGMLILLRIESGSGGDGGSKACFIASFILNSLNCAAGVEHNQFL